MVSSNIAKSLLEMSLIAGLLGFSSASFGDEETGKTLTIMFRAARSVLLDKKIVDLNKNPKSVGLEMAEAQKSLEKKYLSLTGRKLEIDTDAARVMKMAIDQVFENAFTGKYRDKWATTKHYPGKLLPARFAREVGQKLKEFSGGKYELHVTTFEDCLVNPDNKPDSWEKIQMSKKFATKSWERGKGFYQTLAKENEARYINPEYYDASCLNCHGGDPGKIIHPNCPNKELGEFAGAISIVMKE
ncbi:MAG: hypothetical protein A4S09_01865 [Proteobacteria bacterium SG_bin7]|nr:MAG: hypothetical protein A4S09_01865 [Proteobacteria bacterium SG_bin7]